jgi:hypothetical protein
LNSGDVKELSFHAMERFSMPVFEISEGLPKPKRSRTTERQKDHGKRIELAIATKVMERQPTDRNTPALAS